MLVVGEPEVMDMVQVLLCASCSLIGHIYGTVKHLLEELQLMKAERDLRLCRAGLGPR